MHHSHQAAMITPLQPRTPAAPSTASSVAPLAYHRSRRKTYPHSSSASATTPTHPQRPPLQVIREAAAAQEALDARRQGIEAAIASGKVNPVVVAALHAILRSVHADRETARHCLKALLFDPADHAATLAHTQASQSQLLDRASFALAYAPLVQRVDAYLRDRNLPRGTVAYCLDAGPASWLRVRAARIDVPLPPAAGSTATATAAAVARAFFSAITLEVTRQLPLAAVGPDIRSLHRLFSPLTVTLLKATTAGTDEREREVLLVLEIASASASAAPSSGPQQPAARFVVEVYGFRTHFPAAAHAADAALIKKWAGRLLADAPSSPMDEAEAGGVGPEAEGSSSDLRVPATRHVLGLRIPFPHPRLVPECAPTPLAIKLSVR